MAQRILVVEDDEAIANLIKTFLEDEGYVVDIAVGELALVAAHETPRPAIVLLDLMMPGMNGYEVAAGLRADPQTARVPIVVMSAADRVQNARSQLGADGYLAKPFKLSDLFATVVSLGGRSDLHN